MVPPAPGRFSMTMGCRSWGESLSVTVRAMMSVPLPGVNGTTILIGFEGQACAHAADCAAQSSPSTTKDLPSFPDILASRAGCRAARPVTAVGPHSKPREQFFVFAVRPNPEPNYHAFFHDAECTPIKIDSHRIDGQLVVDLLESERRMCGLSDQRR